LRARPELLRSSLGEDALGEDGVLVGGIVFGADCCSVRMAAGGIPQSMRRRAARADSGGCLESKALPPEIKMRGLLPARYA
jgi:hypothetical protein